jgi:hypothetical protein
MNRSRIGAMAAACLVVCLSATAAQAQLYHFGPGAFYRRPPAYWPGYSGVVAAPFVAAPPTVVYGATGGCSGQATYAPVPMALMHVPVYSYVPVTSGYVMAGHGGGCYGSGMTSADAQKMNATLTSINDTLGKMNTTLTSIDGRLQSIQTDIAKMARDGIKVTPPKPEEKRDKIPNPPPNPADAKPAPVRTSPPAAPTDRQLTQAAERNRAATAELQALLDQIKPPVPRDGPPDRPDVARAK